MPKVTVVSINSDSFKVAAFRQEGSFRKHLLSYKATSAEDFSSHKYAESKKHLSKSNVSAIIARDMCAVRYLSLPSSDPLEIVRMVELQKPKLFPFKYRQAVVQPIIYQTDSKGKSKVMVVVMPTKILYDKLQVLNLAGIYPKNLYLSSSILFERFNEKFIQTETHKKNCLIINIENNSLDIIISSRGDLVFTYGAQLPYDRQAACNKIINDLERAIRIFRKDHQEEVEFIIVNSSSYTANLLSVIENRMHIKSIVSNTLELMEAASQIEDKKARLLNIMPPEILKVNLAYKIKKLVLLPAFSIFMAMSLISSVLYFYLLNNKVDIEKMNNTPVVLMNEAEASLEENQSAEQKETITIDAYSQPEILSDSENLKLVGVMLSPGNQQALIRDEKKGVIFSCALGEVIPAGKIISIEFNKVLIENDCQTIELFM
jgi:hypothetical protein